jgi:hypothetical protein
MNYFAFEAGNSLEALLREAVGDPDIWVPGIGNEMMGTLLFRLTKLPAIQAYSLVSKCNGNASFFQNTLQHALCELVEVPAIGNGQMGVILNHFQEIGFEKFKTIIESATECSFRKLIQLNLKRSTIPNGFPEMVLGIEKHMDDFQSIFIVSRETINDRKFRESSVPCALFSGEWIEEEIPGTSKIFLPAQDESFFDDLDEYPVGGLEELYDFEITLI